jgi:hypothetical protein
MLTSGLLIGRNVAAPIPALIRRHGHKRQLT